MELLYLPLAASLNEILRGPTGQNKDTNVSQLTGISSTDFLSAGVHSRFLS